jgi:hypothetical protein
MNPVITQQMFDEGHYLPANNAQVAHFIEGPDGEREWAEAEARAIQHRCVEEGMPKELAMRLADWYRMATGKCFDAFRNGTVPAQFDSLYERFIL